MSCPIAGGVPKRHMLVKPFLLAARRVARAAG
jgi:hypothetical protein